RARKAFPDGTESRIDTRAAGIGRRDRASIAQRPWRHGSGGSRGDAVMGEDDSDDALQAGGEDRLPWLEAVEEEDAEGPSIAKLVAAIVIGLVAIGVIVGGLFWLGNRGQDATGEVIAAPQGDYKVRPADPGGMNVSGEGDV